MAKTILEVPVDDGAFKAFYALFGKYRETLSALPLQWGKINAAQRRSFYDTGKGLTNVEHGFLAVAKAQKQNSEAINQAGRKQDDLNNKARKSVSVFQGLGKQTSGIAKDMAAVGFQFAKIAALGLTAAATGSLFGFGLLASGAGDLRRRSKGLGVSAGDLQAAEAHYGSYFDPATALGNIADVQSDMSRRWILGRMGVSNSEIQNKNAADLLPDVITKAVEEFKRGGKTQQMAEATGLTQIFDMSTLRELASLTKEELKERAQRFGVSRGTMGINDRTLRRFQEFDESVAAAGRRIKDAFIIGLEPLAPKLQQLTTTVADAISGFLKTPQAAQFIDDFGDAVKKVTEYLGSEDFNKDAHTFVDSVEFMAGALGTILRGWGMIFDASGSLVRLPSRSDQYNPGEGPKRDTGNQKMGSGVQHYSEYGKPPGTSREPPGKVGKFPVSYTDPTFPKVTNSTQNARDEVRLSTLSDEIAQYSGDFDDVRNLQKEIRNTQTTMRARGAQVPVTARVLIQNNTGGSAIASASALPY